VKPLDDQTAKRIAEIRQELAAQEQELDRHLEQHEREAAERAIRDRDTPALRRAGRGIRSFLVVLGILVLAVGLTGLAVTLNRMSPDDVSGAEREGQATVRSCRGHGPISFRGFGYWQSCDVQLVWEDGQVESEFVDEVFSSSDIGTAVRVGDLGRHRTHRVVARADAVSRPWLDWLSYGVGALALIPTFVAVMILKEFVRIRRRT
jgi:hypothetical protein